MQDILTCNSCFFHHLLVILVIMSLHVVLVILLLLLVSPIGHVGLNSFLLRTVVILAFSRRFLVSAGSGFDNGRALYPTD